VSVEFSVKLSSYRGDSFYADVNTLGLEEMHKDTEDGIDRMVNDLEKQ